MPNHKKQPFLQNFSEWQIARWKDAELTDLD